MSLDESVQKSISSSTDFNLLIIGKEKQAASTVT